MNEILGTFRELGRGLLLSGRVSIFVAVGVRIVNIVLPIDDEVVKFVHARCLERNCADQHSIEAYTCAPDVDLETFITLIFQDLRCNVSRCSALLRHSF